MAYDYSAVANEISQIRSRMAAQDALLQVIVGMIAATSPDWREQIDKVGMLAESSINSVHLNGTEAECATIRSGALQSLWGLVDQIHVALLVAERGEPLSPPP